MFSKTFGYALRAVVYVSIHGGDGNKVSLQDLSANLDIPHHFLGKIMQDMVRHGIVDSIKGPSGGFFANEDTNGTILLKILKITDGSTVFETCALGIRRCNSDNPCPLHKDVAASRGILQETLSHKNIHHLALEVENGDTFLSR
jgi:Rrf2 family protein